MRNEKRYQHESPAHVCGVLAYLDYRGGNVVFVFCKPICDLSSVRLRIEQSQLVRRDEVHWIHLAFCKRLLQRDFFEQRHGENL